MNLTLSEEQLMLRDSVDSFLAKHYTLSVRQEAISSPLGYDAAIWRHFAELGWLALPLPEAYGGLGGSPVDTAILMEAFGRALVVEPWLPAAVIGANTIMRFGSDIAKAALLPDIASGVNCPALAHIERQAGYNLSHVATTAQATATGFNLSGNKFHVVGANCGSYFLITARQQASVDSPSGIGIFIVPRDAKGLQIIQYPLVDGTRAARLELDNVHISKDALLAENIALEDLEALFDTALAAMMADAVGAMGKLLEATIEHCQQRTQFGKPLAEFQALRHRIAEMKIRCEEARAAALLAALSLDKPRNFRVRCISSAKAKIGNSSRKVAQEAMQLHGAMGISEETSIGQLFKRLFVFETSFGSTAWHLTRYRETLVSTTMARTGVLDSATSPDERAFRDEVRHFLAESLSFDLKDAERLDPGFLSEHETGLAWQRIVHEKGWSAPAWPQEHGGPGWDLTYRYIFDQECELAGEPHFRGPGHKMLAPVLMKFGTPEQKRRFLPRILSGEDCWAQGYSEPNAGSDLASLKTRAVRDGNHYIINGTKIWTTHAHVANWLFALVRTDDTGKKQSGISFILIDMKTTGITVRPIISICGTHEFNQIFFDDVRVPKDNLIGEEGAGWDIAKYLLSFERGGTFAGGSLRAAFAHLFDLGSVAGPDGTVALNTPAFATRFAELGTDLDAYEMMELTILSDTVRAQHKPGAITSSITKVQRTRIKQAINELAASIAGYDGLEWEPERPIQRRTNEDPAVQDRRIAALTYFNSRGQSVFGGSNEIQLEIISGELLR